MSPPTRTCRGTTKAGNPCRSTAVAANGYCFVHGSSPSLLAETARRAGERSGAARREQGRSVRDRLRERVEAEVELVWSAFVAGLESEDERVRVTAASALLSEAYGRPPQAIVGDAERPVRFLVVSPFAALEDGDGGPLELPERTEESTC